MLANYISLWTASCLQSNSASPGAWGEQIIIDTHIHIYINWPAVWLVLSAAAQESVCQLIRLVRTFLSCLDLTLSRYEGSAHNYTHSYSTCTYCCCVHWHWMLDTYTKDHKCTSAPSEHLCVLLWVLLGGPPPVHQFRRKFGQLAVMTRQMSAQKQSQGLNNWAGEQGARSTARPCILYALAARSF